MTTLRCSRCERFAVTASSDERAQAALAEHELHEHREQSPGIDWTDDDEGGDQ